LSAKGRSLSIEDIKGILDFEYWKPEDDDTYIDSKSFDVNRVYPYMYYFEEYSSVDGERRERGNGLAKSEQDKLYPLESYNNYEASISLDPIKTNWNKEFLHKNFVNTYYYSILFKDIESQWLASRSVDFNDDSVLFGMQIMKENVISQYTLCSSDVTESLPEAKGFPVRPMVEIDLSKVNIDTKSNSGISKDDAFTLEAK
jgi:hypothetical protein